MNSTEAWERFGPFIAFAKTLDGDEKSEAQTFLDRFFRALGHQGAKEAGATFEYRVANKPGSTQLALFRDSELLKAPKAKIGVKFADLLWPGRVVIEMKSRGEKLERHYDQLFNYWSHIVPQRPPYAILCNFDEFWIYQFNEQLFDPVDRILTADIAKRHHAFGFLLPEEVAPLFNNNRVAVTRKAADHLAEVFRYLTQERPRGEGIDSIRAQRFILQVLIGLVSEDIQLLPDQIVTRLLDDCASGATNSYDALGGLFSQMNSRTMADGGRFKGVRYFNGGLFTTIDPIELKRNELMRLRRAADEDWSEIRPEILGTLFQHSMNQRERHAFGAHFTSEVDINKVIEPTIARPWRERINSAKKNRNKLKECLRDIRLFRVLDPACGSGNFLYIAYRVLKRLERDILVRLRDLGEPQDNLVSVVSPLQLYGIDVLPTAVEIARVTLTLAKELELLEAEKLSEADGLQLPENPLPLDNLEHQIQCADALFTAWPRADAIIGNPPYLGSRYIPQELGYDYAERLYKKFAGIPKMADFCSHWFRLAHDALPPGGRAGLVGTNTIRQNETREASLSYIVEHGGTITEAISTQVWSGEARVHVSIVNWIKGEEQGPKRLQTQLGSTVDGEWVTEDLPYIGPTLASSLDVSKASKLSGNKKPKLCFQGQNPVNSGFFLTPEEASGLISREVKLREVIHPYITGDDLIGPGRPTRWIIDFAQMDQFQAREYGLAFDVVRERVMETVIKKAEEERIKKGAESTRWTRMAERWWQFRDYQPGAMSAISGLSRYIVCSRVTKRPIFGFVSSAIHPDCATTIVALEDDYSFGIIQSGLHFEWFRARCSTFKADFRYTNTTVFDTFPWPQSPDDKHVKEVAEAAVSLRQLRQELKNKLGYSLRELYKTLEEPGENALLDAHNSLDASVRKAYGMSDDQDGLHFLLSLNQICAHKEQVGEALSKPGLPLPSSLQAQFISGDFVESPQLLPH